MKPVSAKRSVIGFSDRLMLVVASIRQPSTCFACLPHGRPHLVGLRQESVIRMALFQAHRVGDSSHPPCKTFTAQRAQSREFLELCESEAQPQPSPLSVPDG